MDEITIKKIFYKGNLYFEGIPVYDQEEARVISKEKNWLILDILRKCGSRGATEKEILWLIDKEYHIGNHSVSTVSESEINTRLNRDLKDFVSKRRETTKERENRINELNEALFKDTTENNKWRDFFGIETSQGIGRINRLNRWYTKQAFFPDVTQVTMDFGDAMESIWTKFLNSEGDLLNKKFHDFIKNTIEELKSTSLLPPKGEWCPRCKLSHEAEEFVCAIVLPIVSAISSYNIEEIFSEQGWVPNSKKKEGTLKTKKIIVDKNEGVVVE